MVLRESFDVQNRETPLFKNAFLEASAGTGKTFAIVTLVVRMVLEGVELREILVVTFTKLATRELQNRLRTLLKETLHSLQTGKKRKDYVAAIVEKDPSERIIAIKRVERAIATFDESNIFTIHSFCFKSLEEYPLEAHLSLEHKEEVAPQTAEKIVKDYLRFSKDLTPRQMDLLLKSYGYDINSLIKEIIILSEKRVPIESGRGFDEIFKIFVERMSALKERYATQCASFYQDLLLYALAFEKMKDRSGKLKREVVDELKKCADLFSLKDIEVKDFPFCSILLSMQRNMLLKKAVFPESRLFLEIQEHIVPLIQEAQDEMQLLGRVANGARKMIEEVIEKEEIFFYEDILLFMEKQVLKSLGFAEKIRSGYRAVFIDEFQDTDSTQWNIFSTLFLAQDYQGVVYLIGDPKQSIYRFRKADLYTYFDAKGRFKEDEIHTLDVNFRSEPPLVDAMNALFSEVSDFLLLPKTQKSLPVLPVKPGVALLQERNEPSIHFCEGHDESEFFRFIVEEFKTFNGGETKAVLVKDRYQEKRFLEFCKTENVSAIARRSHSLIDSQAYFALQELIEALLNPKNQNLVGIALFGPIFLQKTCDETIREQFVHWHEMMVEKGLLFCFRNIMDPEGTALYSDLVQLVEILSEKCLSHVEYLPYLAYLKREESESEMLKKRFCGSDEAILVQTIHASKGLEYDIVFPVGLMCSQEEKRRLIYDFESRTFNSKEQAFKSHLDEVESEKMRLLYVALTRAKRKMYIPVLMESKKSNAPLTLFFDKLLKGNHLQQFVEKQPHMVFSSCLLREKKEVIVKKPIVDLVEPCVLQIAPIALHHITSFSALKQSQEEFENTQTDQTLPKGAEFGNFMHMLFEKISFQEAFKCKTVEEISSLLTPLFLHSAYLPWKEPIAEMIYRAFHIEFLGLEPFSLAMINPNCCIKEMEFLYQTEDGNFLKGFIDLVFEYKNHLYFLDWKTNDLGGNYCQEALGRAMVKSQYHLQKEIYDQAVNHFLALFDTKIVKGCAFYVFLRGLKQGQGVFVDGI